MKKPQQFDERQKLIRGKVMGHGVLVFTALVLTNGFLNEFVVVWAGAFNQSVILILITALVLQAEMMFRDVYIRPAYQYMMAVLWGLVGVISTIGNIKRIVRGELIIESGALSELGSSCVISIFLITYAILALIKIIIDRKKKAENEAEEN